jgi:hypothetical protein
LKESTEKGLPMTTPKKLPRNYPRVDVDVTQADLDAAIPKDSGHCAIADALRRQLGVRNPEVDLQVVTFTDPKRGVRVSFLTPEICQDHLLEFDHGLPLRPFSFYLRTPIRIRRAGRGAGNPHSKKDIEDRDVRKRGLLEREEHGTITPRERASLKRMRETDEAGGPGANVPNGPVEMVEHTSNNARPVFVGGRKRVARAAVLSNRKGRRREYGLRQSERPELRRDADPERAT